MSARVLQFNGSGAGTSLYWDLTRGFRLRFLRHGVRFCPAGVVGKPPGGREVRPSALRLRFYRPARRPASEAYRPPSRPSAEGWQPRPSGQLRPNPAGPILTGQLYGFLFAEARWADVEVPGTA